MKKIRFLVCVFYFLSAGASYAQVIGKEKVSGVYLTKEDFAKNVVTDDFTSDPNNYLVERFSKKVEVSRGGKKSVYAFGKISGYVKDGTRYRAHGSKTKFFSDYGFYQVLDESGLIIYAKKSSGHKSGGRMWYYYSETATSPIKLISKKNIRKDFADRPNFADAIISSIRSREYLREIDGKLLINQIYLSQ